MSQHQPWDWHAISVRDSSGAVVSAQLLGRPPSRHFWELYSITADMSQDGTGELNSMHIADGPSFAMTNDQKTPMIIRRHENPITTWLHWGRSNQKGDAGQPQRFFPPDFWYDGELWGWLQAGGGAQVVARFTVIFRAVQFGKAEWVDLRHKVPPFSGQKELEDFAP